jgi:hypothetical protein
MTIPSFHPVDWESSGHECSNLGVNIRCRSSPEVEWCTLDSNKENGEVRVIGTSSPGNVGWLAEDKARGSINLDSCCKSRNDGERQQTMDNTKLVSPRCSFKIGDGLRRETHSES